MSKHLDLASVFKREKAPAPTDQVTVVGVVTMKSEGFEAVRSQIAGCGVDVSTATELPDGSVAFTKSMEDMEDSTVVRISENAVIAVKGLKPYMMDMEMADGETFESVCKEQGFFPGVGSTIDILRESVLIAAADAATPAEAATLVSKMFDEAKAYTLGLVNDLPAMAFKLEGVQDPSQEVSAPAPTVLPPASGGGDSVEGGGSNTEESTIQKGEGDQPPTPPSVGSSTNPPQSGITVEDVSKIIGTQLGEFAVKMEGLMADRLASVMKSVSDTTEAVTALGTRVESAEAAASAAAKAVEGTVVLGASGSSGDPVAPVQKRERIGGEIDTGFRPVTSSRSGR